MAHEFTYTRRVEFAETDAEGVAHFAVYFRYMEEAEHAFYRSLGGSAYERHADRVEGMPRVSVRLDYRRPLRYGDVVYVHLIVREKREKGVRYDVAFRRRSNDGDVGDGREDGAEDDGEGVEVARGSMTVVSVTRPLDSLEWTAVPLPPPLRDGIQVAPEEGG